MSRLLKCLCFFSISLIGLSSVSAATVVRMETSLGNIDIELHEEDAPHTVRNFLYYVNNGLYNNSIIHRSVSNFVVQGGGYTIDGADATVTPVQGRVINEPGLSNLRGTIGMAKPGNDINGATNQWFFNVVNNVHLDSEANGEFTVFGTVVAGMDVVDAINALSTGTIDITFEGTDYQFSNVPYLNDRPSVLHETDAVLVTAAYILDVDLTVNSGLNGTWFNPETSGSGILMEILPVSNLAFMAWFTWDTELPAAELTSVIGDPGQRWLTGFGAVDQQAKTITFDLTNTSGGLFDNELDVTNSEAGTVGSVVITFIDCENATITYNMVDSELSNTRSLIRISTQNTELCKRLSVPVLN